MKNYKRLTKRKDDGRWGFADNFPGFYNPRLETIASRLCDIEDKIEKRIIINVNCGIYQIVRQRI